MKRHRIERLIESRGLEAVEAPDEEVVSIWAAALREWSDAAVPGLSVAGAFTHAYQAALRAATALVRASGYRVRGAVGGHHHATFYTLAALGDEEMERVADAMQNVRGGRNTALYGDEDVLEPADLDTARAHAGSLLSAVHAALGTMRPALAPRLPPPAP